MDVSLNIVKPHKVTFCLVCIVAVLTVLSVVGQVCHYTIGWTSMYGFIEYFYLDDEANVPTYYSSMALLLAAGLLAMVASIDSRIDKRFLRHWWVLAGLFACLSMDEIIGVHEYPIERLRTLLDAGGIFYYTWVIPGMAFVAFLAVVYAKFLWNLPARTRNLFIAAAATFVGGAIGVEMISGYYADLYGEANLLYALIITVEEILEMLGVVIFIHANLDYLHGLVGGILLESVPAKEKLHSSDGEVNSELQSHSLTFWQSIAHSSEPAETVAQANDSTGLGVRSGWPSASIGQKSAGLASNYEVGSVFISDEQVPA